MRTNHLLLQVQKLRNIFRALCIRFSAWSRTTVVHNGRAPVSSVRTCRFCRGQTLHECIGPVPLTHSGALSNASYTLMHCTACDVVYLDPLPSDIDLKVLYEKTDQFTGLTDSQSLSTLRVVRSYARRLRYLALLPKNGDSLLEVGAGVAWISRVWKEHDARARTVAQDVSDECSRSSPWVDHYHVGALPELPREEYQLVSMTHVIEHLPAPEQTIALLRDYVRLGGHVYITAPFRPPMWKTWKGIAPWLRYSYLHVPAHISYLSKKWLSMCAKKNGFELVHWDNSHDGYQVFEAVLRRRV